MNLSVMLRGLVQSNQRAELLAVVLSCLRDPRPLDIRTDSEYVCKGATTWIMRGSGICLLKECVHAQLVFVCHGGKVMPRVWMWSAVEPPRKTRLEMTVLMLWRKLQQLCTQSLLRW